MRAPRWLTVPLCILCIAVLPVAGHATVMLTLLASDDSLAVGEQTRIDVVVSGLVDDPLTRRVDEDALGAFQLRLVYNPFVLQFDGLAFGDGLDVLDMGTVNGFFEDPDPNVGAVNFFEVSLDPAGTLEALQPDTFSLAQFTFTGIAAGNVNLDLAVPILSDPFGNRYTAPADGVNVRVPEAPMLALFAVGLLGLAISFPARVARAQGEDVIVTQLPVPQAELAMDINPTNPDNLVVYGNSEDNGSHYNASYSLDGGRTWDSVEIGRRGPGCDDTAQQNDCIDGFRSDPVVIFDDDGRLYLTHSQVGEGNGTLVVCRSDTGGRTYLGCTVVDRVDIDKPWLAAGIDPLNPGQRIVHITQTKNTLSEVEYWRSTDGGATFTRGGALGVVGGFSQPVAGPFGELYVTYLTSRGVDLKRSFDGGLSFETDAINIAAVDAPRGWGIPAQPDRGIYAGPTSDIDRSNGPNHGRLYVAYASRGPGADTNDLDIFITYSDDFADAGSWSTPQRINDDGGVTSQFLPWLDVDQRTGLVSVVWYDARNDPDNNELVEVFMAVSDGSTDGTGALRFDTQFPGNIVVSDGQTDADPDPQDEFEQCPQRENCTIDTNLLEYIGLASRACVAHVAWSDNSATLDLDYVTDRVEIPNCRLVGDVDQDGDVDEADLLALIRALGDGASPGDPRDLDGDGLITVADARRLLASCDEPRCGIGTRVAAASTGEQP